MSAENGTARKRASNGKIAGQGTKKDSVTTLLFKTKNENFAELFNRTILVGTPIAPDDLDDGDIKETAFLNITKEGGGTSLVQWFTHNTVGIESAGCLPDVG